MTPRPLVPNFDYACGLGGRRCEPVELLGRLRGGCVTRRPHVDFGAQPQSGRAATWVDIEDDPLTLADHPEHRTIQAAWGEFILAQIPIAQETADACTRVIGLDHTLHTATLTQRDGPAPNRVEPSRPRWWSVRSGPVVGEIPSEPIHLVTNASAIHDGATDPEPGKPQRDLVEQLARRPIMARHHIDHRHLAQVDD